MNNTALSLLFFVIVLLNGCAGQRPPEGGPLDTTPPEIISIYPAPNTILYSDNKIVFEFSEYVDRRSFEESIFISPSLRDIEFDWSGTEVEMIVHETLRKNTTYVITVGTDVTDVRNRNRLANSFSLSFSTGDKIDNGMITGAVFDEKPDGVMIFSYRLDDIKPDTLNPVYTRPDYLTQTGKNGRFALTNLAPGTYRLFAIRDDYKNLLYDPETDAAGTTDDVTITEQDTLKTDIKFIIAQEDTTPPRIASVQVPDRQHVVATFSEPLDSATVQFSSFTISDTAGANRLPMQSMLRIKTLFPNNEQYSSITLVTDQHKDLQVYVVSVDGVKDLNGFVINPLARQKQFTGSGVADSSAPGLASITVKDSLATVLAGDSITVSFSDAIAQPVSDSAFIIRRQRDSSKVDVRAAWINPAKLSLKPRGALEINQRYLLELRWNYLKDLFGNRHKDSVTTFRFGITDPEQFGSIEGSFAGFGSLLPVVIQAENIVDKRQKAVKTKTSQFGKFAFTLLPEGRYALKAFEDRNNNFTHDAGKIYPYQPAEKFTLYSDTIRVRPRWPVDGVIFKTK